MLAKVLGTRDLDFEATDGKEIFGNLVDTIASNPLLLWSVGFAIVCGAIGVGLKVVRKFGLKGRRS